MEDTYLLGGKSKSICNSRLRVCELNTADFNNLLRGTFEEGEDFYGPDPVIEAVRLPKRLGYVGRGELDCDPAHRELRMVISGILALPLRLS